MVPPRAPSLTLSTEPSWAEPSKARLRDHSLRVACEPLPQCLIEDEIRERPLSIYFDNR
jgi:hypothetical protein